MALRKVKLYGKLGQLFGREWNLDVNSVGEAIKAIDINTNNKFSQYLLKNGTKKYYKICVKNKNNTISKEEIGTSFGNGDIYITPIISGSDKRAIGQIILGVVMVVAAYYGGGFQAGGSSFFGTIGTMGISMILGGVAQLLAPNPNAKSTDQRNSYLFQGNATTVYQGTAVGLVYGRALVPPMPVCISTDTNDISTYEGAIVNLGKTGILDNSLLFFSYKEGRASLIGHSELADATVPPKKYLIKTYSGIQNTYTYIVYPDKTCDSGTLVCTQTRELTGSCIYDKNTTTPVNTMREIFTFSPSTCNTNISFGRLCDESIPGPFYGPVVRTKTEESVEATGNCGYDIDHTYGGRTYGIFYCILTEEDTELNAIARLLPTLTWSAWQSTPIYPYYQQRVSGFSFYYRIVKTKSITLPDKYNPGFTYKYATTVERRIYGSSDPWIEAETIVTDAKPQSDGTLILPEVDIPNVSGYETKVKTISLNYN